MLSNFITLNREASSNQGNYRLDETFGATDLNYGPQGWAPYASKMPIVPGGDVNRDEFYVMFVDLNATSNLNSTFPECRWIILFLGYMGLPAFHVYGYIHSNSGISWTNRVDGDGSNGYYVTSNPQTTNLLAGVQVMEDYDHVYVKVANHAGAVFNDFGNNTYFMRFEKAGGGLNSLHITTDPKVPNGQTTIHGQSDWEFLCQLHGRPNPR